MEREMSDSSERGEAATAGPDDGKQKMIKELKDVGMYEGNMSTKEMTDLLIAIKESTQDNWPASNKYPQMPDQTPPNIQPGYSQAVNSNHMSLSQRSSVSPELSPNRHANSQEKRKDSSDESVFTPHKNNFNKTRLSINENTSALTNENKRGVTRMNSQLRSENKVPKWKINPLDYVANDKDAPLKSRFSSPSNRDKESSKASYNVEMAIGQLSLHLQKVSDSRRGERRTQYGTTWGTGIKASTTFRSLDEKDSVDEAIEAVEEPTATDENLMDELPSGRKRRACVKLHTYSEIVENNSDEDFEVCEKKRKPEAAHRESSNSVGTKMNVGKESSRRPKNSPSEDGYTFESLLDDSDEEVTNVTKKKKVKPANEKKVAAARSTGKKSVEPVSTEEAKDNTNRKKRVESNSREKEDETPICLEDSDEIMICDNVDTSRSPNKPKKSVAAEATSSTSSYPRRIVPPNPFRYSGIRARKPLHPNALQVAKQAKPNKDSSNEDNENDKEVTRTISRGRSTFSLADDEIIEALESDEETSSSNQSKRVAPKLSNRMKNQCELLRAESQKDREAERNRQQERRLQEEAADRLKQERVKQRVREEAEKVKTAELEEKRKLAAEERWRMRCKTKEKEKHRQTERTELNPEGPRNTNDAACVEVMVKNPYATNETVERMVGNNRRGQDTPPEGTPCPICNKKFPVAEIETHAASCEEYDAASSAGGSRSNSPVPSTPPRTSKRRSVDLFECDTCSNYRAKDGRDFEQHVKACLSRLKNDEPGGSGSIVSVPDSPIRTLRRNSEQTDSEINYATQFVPKSRSKVNTGVKRKR